MLPADRHSSALVNQLGEREETKTQAYVLIQLISCIGIITGKYLQHFCYTRCYAMDGWTDERTMLPTTTDGFESF